MKIKYRRATLNVEGERPKKCCICGNSKKIDLHHYRYSYSTKEVRKNPQLVLENTIPVCFHCHQIADSIRKVTENWEKGKKIINIIEKLEWIDREFKKYAKDGSKCPFIDYG